MPLVEVRVRVIPLKVIGIEHPISAEESAVCAGGLAVVECFAVSVVEQQFHIVTHGLLKGEHEAVVPGVENAGLIEDQAGAGIESWCSVGRHGGGQLSWGTGNRRGENVIAFGCRSGRNVGVVTDRQAKTSR